MTFDRRQFLLAATAASASGITAYSIGNSLPDFHESTRPIHSVHSVIPVVGDGKWIWRDPPKDKTGYLEPRTFEAEFGIHWTGSGGARQLAGTTVVPSPFPEQKLNEPKIETEGCRAWIRSLDDGARQLAVEAGQIERGQTISAVARFRVTLSKAYMGYARDQFPAEQVFEKPFLKKWLADSPGIKASVKSVRQLAKKIVGDQAHPWEKAQRFYKWVWENIKGVPGDYTSVKQALKKRVGDCEERAGVFIALCRAEKIPARLVWIPNHSWAEFCLLDESGKPHWIPAHTAAYSWFGWTGAHELVLQKGDRIWLPEKRKSVRLLADWSRWRGARPDAVYTATLKPVAESEKDPGPGSRNKTKTGEWKLIGKHPDDRYMRR